MTVVLMKAAGRDLAIRDQPGADLGADPGADPGGRLRDGAAQVLAAPQTLPLPIWLFLAALLLPVQFQIGPLSMTLLRLLLLIMIVPLTIRLFRGQFGRVYPTDILFFLHIGWATVALAVNNPNLVVQNVGSNGIDFIGAYVLARAYIRNRESFTALCRALVIVVFLTVPFAVFETLTGRPVIIDIIEKLPGLSSLYIVNMDQRMGLERVQVVFSHPIHYGLFCSVVFSLTFVALKGRISSFRRYVSSIVVVAAGFLALSSGAFLAILLQLALILWNTVLARVRLRWVLLGALFALAYIVIDLLSNRTPIRVFMSYATFSAQTAYWRSLIFQYGTANVWANPFFGLGQNDWVRPYWMYTSSVDNFWLVMAMRYGIPGFLFITFGYAGAVLAVMRRNFTGDAVLRQLRLAWVFTFLGLSFTLSTVHIWNSIYSFVFFMLGTGFWMITAQPQMDAAARTDTPPDAGDAPRRRGGPGPVMQSVMPLTAVAGPRYTRFGLRPVPQSRSSATSSVVTTSPAAEDPLPPKSRG